MAEFSGLYLVVGIVVVALAVIGLSEHLMGRRVREFAEERGWQYTRRDPDLPKSFPQVAPFAVGSGRRAAHVLEYHEGERVGYSFTYMYSTGAGKSRRTHRHHVVSLELPHPLPQLVLRPETPFASVGKMFGVQDVQFESEEFNRAWLVQSQNLQAAHDVIHPRMMEWLITVKGVSLIVEGRTLFVTTPGAQNVRRIDSMIEMLRRFEAEVPEYVWQKAQGEY